MYIYLLDVKMIIINSFSLKDKRRVIRSIIDYARHNLHISSAELSDQDMLNIAHLGFVTISNKNDIAKEILENLLTKIERDYPVDITDYYLERL